MLDGVEADRSELEGLLHSCVQVRKLLARSEGRIGGRRKKLNPKKRLEIAESVLSGRKSAAEMARLYEVSRPTVSRIIAEHRQKVEKGHAQQP